MRELKFETPQGKFILLEIPRKKPELTDPYITHIDHDLEVLAIQNHRTGEYIWGYDIHGPAEVLGFVRDLTEEQLGGIVETRGATHFKRYHKPGGMIIASIGAHVTKTASDSFRTLVESQGYYLFENPLRDPGLIPSAELDRYRQVNDLVFHNPFLIKVR